MSIQTAGDDSKCFCQREYVSPIPCDNKLFGSTCVECHKLSMMDKEISKAREHLLGLVNQRQYQCTVVNEQHDVFRRHLPVELCAQVFKLSLEPGDPDRVPGEPWPFGRTTSFLLSQVCKTWKNIAFDTPCLWTSLEVDVQPKDTESSAVGCEVITRVLSRSCTHPLSLWVHMEEPDLSDEIKLTLNSICSQSDRFAELHLRGPEVFFDYVLSHVSSQSSPRLHLDPTVRRPNQLVDGDSKLPNLMRPTALQLHRWPPSYRLFQTDNITEVSFHQFPKWTHAYESVYAFCHRIPLLKKLTIRDFGDSEGSITRDIHTLSNLEILDITICSSYRDEVSLRPLFDGLKLPSLTTLRIEVPKTWDAEGIGRWEGVDIQSLSDLLQRSAPLVLTSLTLIRCSLTHWSHCSVDPLFFFRFRAMRELRELVIEEVVNRQGFLYDIFYGLDDNPRLLPQLTTLRLVHCACFMDKDHLMNFISPERRPFLERLEVVGEVPHALSTYIRDNSTKENISSYDYDAKKPVTQYWVGKLEIRVLLLEG